jgi:hypothetical protein
VANDPEWLHICVDFADYPKANLGWCVLRRALRMAGKCLNQQRADRLRLCEKHHATVQAREMLPKASGKSAQKEANLQGSH